MTNQTDLEALAKRFIKWHGVRRKGSLLADITALAQGVLDLLAERRQDKSSIARDAGYDVGALEREIVRLKREVNNYYRKAGYYLYGAYQVDPKDGPYPEVEED